MCVLDGEEAVISPVLLKIYLYLSNNIVLSICDFFSPVGVVAYWSAVNKAFNSTSISWGLIPNDSGVNVPSNIVSTMLLSPYGPIASAIGPVAKGDLLDMLRFSVLRSISKRNISGEGAMGDASQS